MKGGTVRKLLLRMLRDGQLQRGVEETNSITDATLGQDHRGDDYNALRPHSALGNNAPGVCTTDG